MQLTTTRRTDRIPGGIVAWVAGLVLLAGLVYWSPLIAGLLMVLLTGGIVGTWLASRRPELALLVLSFLVSDLIPSDQIAIPLGGNHLHPEDLTLLGMVVVFVAWGLRRQRLEIPHWSFVGPLLAFAGIAGFSALYAVLVQHVDSGLVVGELRPAVYCVACVFAATMIARRDQLLLLLAGLFVIADLTVGAIIVHQFTGIPQSLGAAAGADLWQIDSMTGFGGGFGSVRVVPPSHVLLYVMENVAFCLVLNPPKIRWAQTVMALQCAVLGVGLLLTYTRAQWIATAIAFAFIVVFLPKAAKRTLARSLYVAVPVIAILLGLVGSGIIGSGQGGSAQAIAERATSIITPDSTLNTASLQWRAFEDQAALDVIAKQPLLGVGIGNDYRNVTLLQGEASGWLWTLGGPFRLTRMVHNSYLYVAVKMGLPALLTFFWFAVAFLVGGTRAYFRIPERPEKPVFLAMIASLPGILFWVIFETHLMRPSGMVTIGLMVGIVVAISSLLGRPGDAIPEPIETRAVETSQ